MDDNTLLAITIVAPLTFFGWVFYLDSKQNEKITNSFESKKRISPPSTFNRQVPRKQNATTNPSDSNIQGSVGND